MKGKLKWVVKQPLIMAAILLSIFAIVYGIIVVTVNSSSDSQAINKITLGTYEKIPLTLEKLEITEEEIKETAEWSITYYNQNVKKDNDKLSLDKLTDKQVQQNLHMDSIDAFYDSIRDYLKETKEKESRKAAYDQICEYLLKTCTIDNLSTDEVKKRLDKNLKDTKESCIKDYGMSFSEYCKSVGMTEEEYQNSLSDHIEKTYKQELILVAIGDKEQIEYKEDDFESYINELVKNGGYDSKQDIYDQYGEDYLKTAYRVEYVVDWLIEKADITYKSTETKSPKEKFAK